MKTAILGIIFMMSVLGTILTLLLPIVDGALQTNCNQLYGRNRPIDYILFYQKPICEASFWLFKPNYSKEE